MIQKTSSEPSRSNSAYRSVGVLSTSYGSEYYLTVEAPAGRYTFRDAFHSMFDSYTALLKEKSLGTDSEIFLRFHLSDVGNQSEYLVRYLVDRSTTALFSLVGQPPASGSKCSLTAYHVCSSRNIMKTKNNDNVLSLFHNHYCSIWMKSMPSNEGAVAAQTHEIFDILSERLSAQGVSIREHLLRTWIYIRDIDRHYREFNDARRQYFDSIGMIGKRWYPSSTGIGGYAQRPTDLVYMESLAVSGLRPEQIETMHAAEYLCPAYEYNVPFERGLKLVYGDRTHYYISGTASIDKKGNILCEGDPSGQAIRTIANIDALLAAGGSGLTDLRLLIVYLRDFADFQRINALLTENLPSFLPYIIVQGAICRSPWLIEVEGIAISDKGDPRFAPFF